MKWEKITSTIGQSAFALYKNGRKLVTLVFNPNSNAARIESDAEKRVFLIREEGFLRNRTVLRNEYGVKIGSAGSDKNRHYIQIDNQKFYYDIQNNAESLPALAIYKDGEANEPLALCDMESLAQTKTSTRKSAYNFTKTQFSLLMAVCWYLMPFVSDDSMGINVG